MMNNELHKKEQDLEALCTSHGISRYKKSIERNKKQQTETKSKKSPAMAALNESIQPMIKEVEKLLEDQKTKRGPRQISIRFLQELGPEVASYLTALAVLDSLTTTPQSTKVSRKIAGYFIDELRYRHFAKHAEALYQWRMKSFNTSSYTHMKRSMDATLAYAQKPQEVEGEMKEPAVPPVPEWLEHLDEGERIQIGEFALNLFVACGVDGDHPAKVEVVEVWTSKARSVKVVRATTAALEWIDAVIGHNHNLSPVALPMVMKPLPWAPGVDGGYVFNKVVDDNGKLTIGLAGKFPLVRSTYAKSETLGLDRVEMPVVYQALNAIQETPYLINEAVLRQMEWMYKNSIKGISGLPLADPLPVPPTPANIETDADARKAWRKAASLIHEENHDQIRQRVTYLNTVAVANLMLQQKDSDGNPLPFFFPHNLDFRGRTYPIPVYLQPQGHDVARGLLLFGEAKPLGSQAAVDWLCIHGANNLGKTAQGEALDKASFEERIQWVLDHSDQIYAAAKFPAEFRSFWAGDNVDNPWQFLAFCFEWKKFCDSGRSLDYKCALPGSMDGSCNGLQHYAALLKDEALAKSVNLIPSEVPQDIYRVVATEVNRRLKADASSDEAKLWITWGKVDRKFVKRPVMTLPYGSGRAGFRNQIKEFLKGQNDKQRPSFYKAKSAPKAMMYMAGVIFDSLATASKSAVEAMKFFQDCAKLAAKSDAPIIWVTPSGLPVQQAYPEMTMKRIDTMLAGGIRCQQQYQTVSTDEDGTKMLNARKQVTGIAPNIIHSLDASAMMLTVKQAIAEGIDHFLMVHDSFGCHMADAPRMSEIVRETFASMYAGSTVLDNLVADLSNNIDVTLLAKDKTVPAPPSQGSLQISEVLGSKYFFA